MTDKNKDRGDEYQFPHDEYIAAEEEVQAEDIDSEASSDETQEYVTESTTPPSKASLVERFPFLQNRRFLMVTGVVVVSLIAFQLMKPKQHTVQVIKQAAPVVNAQQEDDSAMMLKMARMTKDADSARQSASQLQSQVNHLQSSLERSRDENQKMRQALVQLAQQVQGLSEQLKKATTKPGEIKKLPPSPVIAYHLRAVVPGRAWIVGSDHSANSVTVGNKIKNYGVVEAIDADTGRIVTSSGKIITYNSDGN